MASPPSDPGEAGDARAAAAPAPKEEDATLVQSTLDACRAVTASAACADIVTIDDAAVAALAAALHAELPLRTPPKASGENGAAARRKTAGLLLAWNAINFSYFPDEGEPRWRFLAGSGEVVGTDDEANGVAAALAEAVSSGAADWCDPAYLRGLTASRLRALLAPAPGAGALPLLEERAACLRDLGAFYATARGAGGPLAFVEGCAGSAVAFVDALALGCASYRDVQFWKSRGGGGGGGGAPSGEGGGGVAPAADAFPVPFLKRAQLCAAMLHASGAADFGGDLGSLTVFADYRLPQLLRARGVLVYSARLAAGIDAPSARIGAVASDSREEVALRAATVAAADRVLAGLRGLLGCGAAPVTAAGLDYHLWSEAVNTDAAGTLEGAFHRTRTIWY